MLACWPSAVQGLPQWGHAVGFVCGGCLWPAAEQRTHELNFFFHFTWACLYIIKHRTIRLSAHLDQHHALKTSGAVPIHTSVVISQTVITYWHEIKTQGSGSHWEAVGTDTDFDPKDSVAAECTLRVSSSLRFRFIYGLFFFKLHFPEWMLLCTVFSDALLFQDHNNKVYYVLSQCVVTMLQNYCFVSPKLQIFCNSNNNKIHISWWIIYHIRLQHSGIWNNWESKTEKYLNLQVKH